MPGRSAAFTVAIVGVLGFVMGAFVLTTLDPVMQSFFSSGAWSSSTGTGTDLLRWLTYLWSFVSTAILIAIISQIWISTRQPT
jgi:uncharacterized protein YqhQ